MSGRAEGSGVLQGVRVLDFGRYIAGPYCAALLADHGAEVIRIEKRGGSEDRFLAPVAPDGSGTLYLQMNRNKRGMTLDPMSEAGREIVRKLVATADVVVANLPPEVLSAMCLDVESLRAVKPDVILVTATAYGRVGPYRDRVGFDAVGQVMSGSVYMTGEPDRPYRAAVSWVDFATALHLAFGTLLALMARRSDGHGQVVEGALLATAVAMNDALLMEQAVLGVNRVPTGNRGQTSGPTDLFRTRDGWVVCYIIGDVQFRRWARLVGEDAWIGDPRFATDVLRGEHRDVLCERMARWCAERTNADALETLGKAKIPAAPMLSPQEALDDPQVQALSVLEPIDYPGLPRPAPVARTPLWLSRTPGSISRRAPTVGEHTDEILAELGYGAAEIEQLRRDGTV